LLPALLLRMAGYQIQQVHTSQFSASPIGIVNNINSILKIESELREGRRSNRLTPRWDRCEASILNALVEAGRPRGLSDDAGDIEVEGVTSGSTNIINIGLLPPITMAKYGATHRVSLLLPPGFFSIAFCPISLAWSDDRAQNSDLFQRRHSSCHSSTRLSCKLIQWLQGSLC
jgi:hypothetical protein